MAARKVGQRLMVAEPLLKISFPVSSTKLLILSELVRSANISAQSKQSGHGQETREEKLCGGDWRH